MSTDRVDTSPSTLRATPDVQAVAVWFASRALVLVVAAVAGWSSLSQGGGWTEYLALWDRWETPFYESIARLGYAPEGEFAHNAAYFPGLALVIKAGLTIGVPAPATGMVLAMVGGAAASLALLRLTESVGGRGIYGVLAWTLSPVAVFLAAPWAEAPFCAFAFWAWWKGRQGAWVWAGLLAGAAALWRVNGVFLGLALVVMFLTSRERELRKGWALLLPFVVTAGYFGYLWSVTGDPRAWSTAQSIGWDRHFTDPVTSLSNTVGLIWSFNDGVGAPHSRFVVEIIAAAGLLALVVVMLRMRWWAEATLVLITVGSLATSTYYYSVPRTAVVLAPVWMIIGLWMTRRRWFRITYLVVCVPVLVVVTVRFAEGQWIS